MPSPVESLCRIILVTIFLQYFRGSLHSKLVFTLAVEGCNLCAYAMNHFLRHFTAKRAVPIAAAATTITPNPKRVLPLGQDQSTEDRISAQSIIVLRNKVTYYPVPVQRIVELRTEQRPSGTPKSREHQELLRKKRQKDAGTQTDSGRRPQDSGGHTELKRDYVKSLFKAAVDRIRADKWRKKWEGSERAMRLLEARVVAAEKAVEEHTSRLELELELEHQAKASALKTKCDEMVLSFDKVLVAYQAKIQDYDALNSAYTKLQEDHHALLSQVNEIPEWLKALEEVASEWPKLKQMHSVLAEEAFANDPVEITKDEFWYQEHEAMVWNNDAQSEMDDSGCHTCTSDTKPTSSGNAQQMSEVIKETAKGTRSTSSAEMQTEVTVPQTPKLQWDQKFVPADFFEKELANDDEDCPTAAMWKVHGSICLEVGSSKDGQPLHFRLIPQVVTAEAARLIPYLLRECHRQLQQYAKNNSVILAGVQVPSPASKSLQFTKPMVDKHAPIWLRRGRPSMPRVRLGLHLMKEEDLPKLKTSSPTDNPFDDSHAIN